MRRPVAESRSQSVTLPPRMMYDRPSGENATSQASSTRWTGPAGRPSGTCQVLTAIRSVSKTRIRSPSGKKAAPFGWNSSTRDRHDDLAGGRVPDPAALIARPGRDEPAVGSELEPCVLRGHHGGPGEARGGAVPDSHPGSRPRDEEQATTVREEPGVAAPRGFRRQLEPPAGGQVPQRRAMRLCGRREEPTVRGERQPLDRGFVGPSPRARGPARRAGRSRCPRSGPRRFRTRWRRSGHRARTRGTTRPRGGPEAGRAAGPWPSPRAGPYGRCWSSG